MKYFFFDVDGTLVNHEGQIASSTKIAIQELYQQGHKIFLATGRNKAGIMSEVFDLPIHGTISSNGAHIELNDKTIFQQAMDYDILVEVCQDLMDHDADILFSNYQHCLCTKRSREEFFPMNNPEDVRIHLFKEYYDTTVVIEGLADLQDVLVENLDFKNYKGDLPAFVERHSKYVRILPSSIEFEGQTGSGEVMGVGVTKGVGIRRLLEAVGGTAEESIAFGDGYNDFEMLDYVNIGVAMGNANDRLKKGADYVTRDINDDGIYHALVELGFIVNQEGRE